MRAHLHGVANRAGLGVMAEVLEVVVDREVIDDQALLLVSSDDIRNLYEDYVAPTVDSLEGVLRARAVTAGTAS